MSVGGGDNDQHLSDLLEMVELGYLAGRWGLDAPVLGSMKRWICLLSMVACKGIVG